MPTIIILAALVCTNNPDAWPGLIILLAYMQYGSLYYLKTGLIENPFIA